MTKRLLVTVALTTVALFAYACGDGGDTANLNGGGNPQDLGGAAGSSGQAGEPGTSSPQSGASSGTVASSGGLQPADAGSPPPPPPPPAGACLPPNVASVFASKCTSCHADPPLNGSLSGLVTLSDLLATAKEDATKNEAQLSLARMQSAASPMPPASVGNPATAADISALQTWITAGYKSSSCVDGGAPPPATDVFTGAPAYVMTVAGSTHNAGKDCMGGCHNHGFTFAGTVTNGAGAGVAGAEVRLVDANGKAISVYTGTNGNFHSSTSWTAPAKVGVRNAAGKQLMAGALGATQGGCNGCHATGGVQAPIHLP